MFFYQCQLAWRSIKKTPILCALMVLSLACGIAAAMISYAQQYAITRNPFVHKDNTMFMLQTDSWHLKEPYKGKPINQMPATLSYRDVIAFMHSTIPFRKTAMTQTGGAVSVPNSNIKPLLAYARVNSRDYFSMFEESFLFGSVWEKDADENFQNYVVLSEDTNKKLFQGKNSVGKIILFEGKLYQIVGVVKSPPRDKNKIQDVERFITGSETQLYFPLGVLTDHEITIWGGGYECPDDSHNYGTGFQVHLKDSCVWLTFWVEFSDASHKQAYEQFITQYIIEQKKQGFYPRPLRFALSNATQQLVINRYNSGIFSLLVKFGFGFLFICCVNCIAMLLAKFLRHAHETGIRRALGANRMAVFQQHLLESIFIGLFGGLLGTLFTYIGLELLRIGFTSLPTSKGLTTSTLDTIFVLNAHVLIATIFIALFSSVCAGFYPAWRICRTPAVEYLKLQ